MASISSHFPISLLLLSLISLLIPLSLAAEETTTTTIKNVTYDAKSFMINGKRQIILSGSIHYPRSTQHMWPDLIQKAKEGGLDAIESYIFWDHHEPLRRKYDFSGNLDFVKFFKLVQQAGLYGVLRIGPYVCAEWSYGGFPLWLKNTPGIVLRTDNDIYKNEMQTFVTKIIDMCKQAKLFASQGGPIIIAQIENEYGNVMEPYGEAGESYLNWCAEMAVAQNVGVPWIMCQQPNAPKPMINTCNGYYCESFEPNSPNSPKMFTENWVGWFKKWGERDPHRTAEDVAFSVARFFQRGGAFNNYYMYHGGTNFGRSAGGPYIATTYDYDAPLDEYGNLNQPKWGHLKQLHQSLKIGQDVITAGNWTEKEIVPGVNLTTHTNGAQRFCFISNTNTEGDPINVNLNNDGVYWVPSWSVTLLRNCNSEIYNTAKINAQTSLFVKKQSLPHNHENQKGPGFKWVWAPETIRDTLQGKGRFRASQLLEQKLTTSDVSDYLWYMTTIEVNQTKRVFLRVNTTGHVLHAYVNKRFVGSQSGTPNQLGFIFETPVVLTRGKNNITLLSATVGLANYGSFFENKPTGIAGGPVQLVGNDNSSVLNDLSFNNWSYKVGLNGEWKRVFDPNAHQHHPWRTTEPPVNRRMTWYKTSFQTPSGDDPVVVDLLGMGKGHAWVNGNSLGRFWPSVLANSTGCGNCDYRGEYNPDKCVTNCGEPSQRWYHVPRSFMKTDGKSNTLILFEEIGGNPKDVSFSTVGVAIGCGTAYEGNTIELSCNNGKIISGIDFASFGDPKGECGSFTKGVCESNVSVSEVEKACVGKESCSVNVSTNTFGSVDCGNGVIKRLAVQASCA
ncbi:beta-galactosidase 15 [Cannabis sativa]|uniref:beta-galactosidase 15 n=1 Tax=Cannabis sativa TaxID=3483 RepID=UPI0029CA8AF8|nr:beta-galactosidase 15 [Cannabis sativa]